MTFFNTIHRRRVAAVLAMTCAVLPAVSANAATQGQLGATSTGSITINATIAGLVQITGLADLTFSGLNGGTDAQLTENVCVWSNTATKSYTIRATGNGATNAFTLASGTNAPLPYSVAWANSAAATTGTALTTGTTSGAFTSAAILPTCGANANPSAKLFVTIAATDQDTMVANAPYTGVLTLLVTPQ
jgi:hypothetical protein